MMQTPGQSETGQRSRAVHAVLHNGQDAAEDIFWLHSRSQGTRGSVAHRWFRASNAVLVRAYSCCLFFGLQIRNFWDIATGVGAETGNYPEHGQYSEENLGYGSPCGTNGGVNHRAAYRTMIAKNGVTLTNLIAKVAEKENVAFSDLPCGLVRRALPSDPLLYKTHHPRYHRNGEIEKFTENNLVRGIILSTRTDPRGWCKSHGHERKYWALGEHKDANATWCPVGIASEIQKFSDAYRTDARFAGVPTMTMDFSLMHDNASYAREEFRRLLNFTSVQVSRERFGLADHLYIRPDTGEVPIQDVKCDDWQCSCQGFSDHFHTTNMKHWGKAHGNPGFEHWWIQHSCTTTYAGSP